MAIIITNPPGSGGGGGSTAWADITGKPATFTPSAHTHPTAEVTGLDAALAAKQDTIIAGTGITIDVDGKTINASGAADWDALANKPAEFPPEDHAHVSGDISDLGTVLADYALATHTHTVAEMTDVSLVAGNENDVLVMGADDIVQTKTPSEVRGLLGLTTRSATLHIPTPANGTYYISLRMPFAGAISVARHVLASGSLNFAVTINTVNVSGISAVSPTSTPATATATGDNAFASAAVIAVVISSATSASGFAVTIEFAH